jgi:hypothetical protein
MLTAAQIVTMRTIVGFVLLTPDSDVAAAKQSKRNLLPKSTLASVDRDAVLVAQERIMHVAINGIDFEATFAL